MTKFHILICVMFFSTIANSQSKVSDSLAQVLANNKIEDTDRVLRLHQYAYSLVFVSPDKIMTIADEELALAKKLKWERGIAKAFAMKGIAAYYGQGNQAAAMDFYQQSVAIGINGYDKETLCNTYNAIGTLYYNQKQYKKALEYYHNVNNTRVNNTYYKGKETTLLNIGQVHYDNHEKDSAEVYISKSLQLAQEKGNIMIEAGAYNTLGYMYYIDKQYIKAHDYVSKALSLSQNRGNVLAMANALVNMANIQLAVDHVDSALYYGKQGLTAAETAGSMQFRRQAWEVLASIYEKQGNYKAAFGAVRNYAILNDSLLSDESKQETARIEMQYEQTKKDAEKQAEIKRQKNIKRMIVIIGSIILMSFLISFLFYKRRRDALQQKQEAELKAEMIDTEMKVMRLQMNPHFIFNSLNSIGDYISNNESHIANEYLGKFAKLMRMTLENSEKNTISLADDIKALELYMQLEAKRLNGKFDYKIDIATDIDQENTLVPPMIFQPFVENSIWHGIVKKEDKGNILISITNDGKMLHCQINDDGIGRKTSALPITNKEKKSMGMKITKARIDIMNRVKKSNATVEIHDLQQGMSVRVNLPLELNF